MTTYKTPGVYIEEIDKLPHQITTVPSSIPCFVGYTLMYKDTKGNNLLQKAFKIHSLNEFVQCYGSAAPLPIHLALKQTISATTKKIVDTKVNLAEEIPTHPDYLLYYAIQLYFANDGGPCYIYSIGQLPDHPDTNSFIDAFKALETHDESTLLAFPDACIFSYEDCAKIIDTSLSHCDRIENRMVIIDVPNAIPGGISNNQELKQRFRDNITANSNLLRNGAAYFPYLKSGFPIDTADEQIIIRNHQIEPTNSSGETHSTSGPYEGMNLDHEMIRIQDPDTYTRLKSFIQDLKLILPPSGAVAGAFVRNDEERGIWKAPAGIEVKGIVEPAILINDQEQDAFNVDPVSGKSVNVIREFSGKGTLIWGARTLAGNDNEWRYVSVRRFFNMVEESLKKGSEWVVFEPNDQQTWIKLKSIIENYLVMQWKAGALAGARPDDAFYVRVGLGQTMTELDIQNGRLIVEIGMAVVRPAEFIILRFSKAMVTEQAIHPLPQRIVKFIRDFIKRIFRNR